MKGFLPAQRPKRQGLRPINIKTLSCKCWLLTIHVQPSMKSSQEKEQEKCSSKDQTKLSVPEQKPNKFGFKSRKKTPTTEPQLTS